MAFLINPDNIAKWTLGKHVGVTSKLLIDGQNMTVLWSRWEPGALAPEHVHPHEQVGICQQGQIVVIIKGQEFVANAGEYYYIPPGVPHAEKNVGNIPTILTDFFSPVRSDLLKREFNPEIVHEDPS